VSNRSPKHAAESDSHVDSNFVRPLQCKAYHDIDEAIHAVSLIIGRLVLA